LEHPQNGTSPKLGHPSADAGLKSPIRSKEEHLVRRTQVLSPAFAVALAALIVALAGSAVAAGGIIGSDEPETVLQMRVTKDGKLIGTHNDGTVKKAGVGTYEITFSTGPAGGKVPLDIENCAVFATPRVDHESKPGEVSANVDVQRLDGARIYVESTQPLVYTDGKILPFLTNVSFDVAAIC
jgi:hypothetical protein